MLVRVEIDWFFIDSVFVFHIYVETKSVRSPNICGSAVNVVPKWNSVEYTVNPIEMIFSEQ